MASLVAAGKSNREIAQALFLSERTVETHIAALFNKLSVRSRTELVGALLRPSEDDAGARIKTNLPLSHKNLIGRDTELAEISAELQRSRLVTLTGTGGIGKTLTALQVAADVLDAYDTEVWLVELASIGHPALVAGTIAQALGLRETPGRTPLDAIIAHMKRKPLLLLLDNCEHVIEGAASVAAGLLQSCPRLQILATSREPLKIASEQSYRLPSLRVPRIEALRTLTASDAAAYGAVALFAERAHAADHRFALSDENAPIVADICRRLDGIPLAIELAAARVRILSLKAIDEKLEDRFRLLSGGDRVALPRQQTMRALIDWSYDLLSPREQRLFEELSIFAGGCTLAAAVAVCSADGGGDADVLDLLTSLADKSLVVADFEALEPRYRLLESSREYAHERVAARGEYERVARRHALAYLDLAEQLEHIYDTTPELTWLALVRPEVENWRSALAWSLHARGDVATGLRLAASTRLTFVRIATAEGQQWIRTALGLVGAETPPGLVAKLHYADAAMANLLGRSKDALTAARRAESRFRALGDRHGVAFARRVAGLSLVRLGRVAGGAAVLEGALREARGLRNPRLLAYALAAMGSIPSVRSDIARARALFAEEIEAWRAVNDEDGVANATSNFAEIEFQEGNAEAALRFAREALTVHRAHNVTQHVVHGLQNIAAYLVSLARYDEARAHAREALELAVDLRFDVIVVCTLQRLAAVAALRSQDRPQSAAEDRTRAAMLLGFVDARLTALEFQREYTEQQEYDRALTALREHFGAAACVEHMRAGARMSEDRAFDAAFAI